ncbi:MAG: hypothetical protein HVN35_00205 [Methanobacteriaceae archaeon]|nr:hypothetical protein [Methanobacteriaceae archaeon]
MSVSGCTLNTGNLINPKNDSAGDIIQFTVNIQQANNNSYHVNGMMENRGDKKYSFVNLTVIGYNEKKEEVSKTKIMLPSMPAHDYTNYEAWLPSPNGEKITTARIEVINATKED